jgi:hypothetical protein
MTTTDCALHPAGINPVSPFKERDEKDDDLPFSSSPVSPLPFLHVCYTIWDKLMVGVTSQATAIVLPCLLFYISFRDDICISIPTEFFFSNHICTLFQFDLMKIYSRLFACYFKKKILMI